MPEFCTDRLDSGIDCWLSAFVSTRLLIKDLLLYIFLN
ncbi:hypothetical protein F385_3224 [Pantoea agglomerans 299R]|nr:hypothetical protein F385_3224 [Pantoea agglomerans 299R]